MSFIKQSSILIKNSSNCLYRICTNNGISFNYIDSDFNVKKNKEISSESSSLSTTYFDIDFNDNIYGLFTEKNKYLNYLHINNSLISKTLILKYNENKYNIKFPFIKRINNMIHIIFYEISKEKAYLSTLVHYYKNNDNWIKSTIDILNYRLVNNFEVIINENSLKIYYFKIIEGYEELFVANYNLDQEKWNIPYQLTSSKKSKVYLSVLEDSKNIFHISYCEKNQNQFYCKYMQLLFKNTIPFIQKDIFLSTKISGTFPNIVKYKNTLYCQWLQYNHLYSTYSIDNGDNWNEIKLCIDSFNSSFTQFLFKSNFNNDKYLNAPKLYSYENSLILLGANINLYQ